MLFSVQIDTVTAIEPPHIDLTIGHESQPAINPELVKSENYLDWIISAKRPVAPGTASGT